MIFFFSILYKQMLFVSEICPSLSKLWAACPQSFSIVSYSLSLRTDTMLLYQDVPAVFNKSNT